MPRWTTSASWGTVPHPDRRRHGRNGPDRGAVPKGAESAVPMFPWGDLSGRCTEGNGTLDTEDLNGETSSSRGSNENVFRYVVTWCRRQVFRSGRSNSTDAPGQRRGSCTGSRSGPRRSIGTPNLHLIQNLRMPWLAPADAGAPDVVARFALARMRFVGSPWVRRAEKLLSRASPARARIHGRGDRFHHFDREPTDLGYESPPGVIEWTPPGERHAPRGADQREIAADRGPRPRSGQTVPRHICGFPRDLKTSSGTGRCGCGPEGGASGWEERELPGVHQAR